MGAAELYPKIKAAAKEASIPVEWIMGIIAHESSFNPAAKNLTGGDAKRGGAWGLCQLTLTTARGLGFEGTAEQLLDLDTNLKYACMLVAQIRRRYGDRLKTVLSVYNSGKEPEKAPKQTLENYVPSVTAKVLKYQQLISSGKIK